MFITTGVATSVPYFELLRHLASRNHANYAIGLLQNDVGTQRLGFDALLREKLRDPPMTPNIGILLVVRTLKARVTS